MSNSHSQPGLGGASCQPGVCGIIPGCFSYCSTALWTLAIVNIKATFQHWFFLVCFFRNVLRDYGNKYLSAHSEWARDASSGGGVVIGARRLSHVQGNNTLQRFGNIVFVLLIFSIRIWGQGWHSSTGATMGDEATLKKANADRTTLLHVWNMSEWVQCTGAKCPRKESRDTRWWLWCLCVTNQVLLLHIPSPLHGQEK